MRKSVYFSERLDKDIIEYMDKLNFNEDFSLKVKDLLRDGLKFREMGTLENKSAGAAKVNLPSEDSTTSQLKPKHNVDFSSLNLVKKNVDKSVLEDRLNNI